MIDNIKILGKKYKVLKADKFMNVDGRAVGQIEYTDQLIRIEDKMNLQTEKVTLIHEIVHGIFYQLGFEKECTDEHLVQALATSIHQVLTENKEFVKFIIED